MSRTDGYGRGRREEKEKNRKPGRMEGRGAAERDRREEKERNRKPGRMEGRGAAERGRREENERNRKPGRMEGRGAVEQVGGKQRRGTAPEAENGFVSRRDGRAENAGFSCPAGKKCGGCHYLHLPYEKQLALKQRRVSELLKPFCRVFPVTGMEQPLHYRNKVHAVFDRTRGGKIISGIYQEGTHRVVPVDSCLIEDEKADAIICDIRKLLPSFKIKTYDEDTGYGLLRHVLIRTGRATGQIMVVLVLASPILPSKNHFVKALLALHPEITTVVLNVNDKKTSMVLGEKETVLYGRGYIEDELCGYRFRVSSRSFYQVNPLQTEKLYRKAVELARLTGKERVIDAYCGIGTIGIVASAKAGEVIGVELNREAVRDAVKNAAANGIRNISFYQNDAGVFMTGMAEQKERADVVFMDPPRSGSSDAFIASVAALAPERVVYISCNPETLARDLKRFREYGYQAQGAWPYDMFPLTDSIEAVCLLER